MPDKYEAQRLTRDITLRNIPLTVDFCYTPALPETKDEEGCSAMIDIEAVWMEGFDIFHLCGQRTMNEIDEQLWNLLGEE